nr:alpha-N-acetylglucosaminidase [uncultured Allomuricauda sp.]
MFNCFTTCFSQLPNRELKSFIDRIIPGISNKFEIEYIGKETDQDVFEVESLDGKIVLRGNNGVSIGSAFKYYLENFCGVSITWNGTNLKLPKELPIDFKKIRKTTPYKYRYYMNYCTFNYTMSWWDWERWEKEIDWMALNGINMPLALTGQESIWQEVYKDFGFSSKELEGFFSGPTHFAWLWMGNLDGWGGPLPQSWIDSHKELQKRILERERLFGMTPVLPAFTGHVPPNFKDKFPESKLINTNWGHGFDDTYMLDSSDPLFVEIGTKFLEIQTEEYGTDHLYSADTFNENDPPSNNPEFLGAIGEKIYSSMQTYDPQAIWVMQGWMFSYNSEYWQKEQIKGLLNAIPDNNMIILDLFSESHPVWNDTEAYYGKPWIWNLLSNFGGNIGLYGRMRHIAYDPGIALNDPESGNMSGIGLTPEGIEQNPVLYQLMLENVWRNDVINLDVWLEQYLTNRYGTNSFAMEKAWQILKKTVYSADANLETPESIITGRPTFNCNTTMTNTTLSYDPKELVEAWKYFVDEAPEFKDSDGFQYDLVDVTRQVLANYATPLQQKITKAYDDGDRVNFDFFSKQFLELILDMDRLLKTRKDFLLGPWLEDARSWGENKNEKKLYEFNARDLITLWGGKDNPIHDYSCRQWSGLLSDFYRPRWQLFFDYVGSCLDENRAVDLEKFEESVKTFEWEWVNDQNKYPVEPVGDPVETSVQIFQKYNAILKQEYN